MTLLLTGASGFVGRHVQKMYSQAMMECVPLDAGGEPVDLRDAAAVRQAVRGVMERDAPEAVLHLAAQSHVPTSLADPADTFAVNFTGTLHLLQALSESGFRGRLLYVSSGAVYGLVPGDSLPVTETFPCRPRDPYAVSKVAAEALCYQWSVTGPFEIVMARPFNHTGPGQSREFAIPGFAAQLAGMRAGRRAPVLEAGDLSVTRDFCDVRDVVRAYGLLLAQGRNGEAYNVCSGVERKLSDIVDTLARLAGLSPTIETKAGRLRPAEQPRMCGSPHKLKRDTGWTAEIPWEDTLKDLLNHDPSDAGLLNPDPLKPTEGGGP